MFNKIQIAIFAFIFVCFTNCKLTKSSAYYMEKSDNYWFKERLKKSYRYVLKAIKVDPKNDSLYVRAAYCYQFAYFNKAGTKEYDQKIRNYYNQSLGLKPWNANAILGRAQYDFDNNRYALVIKYVDSLLARDKNNVDAYWFKSMVYKSPGKYNDSAKYFTNFFEGLKNVKEMDKPILYHEIISNYLFAKNWERAKYYFLITDKIKKEENTNNLAVCYFKLGQKDSACYYFKEPCISYPCGIYKDSIVSYCQKNKK